MIHFDHVSKFYNDGEASLHNVSLTIAKGEFVTLVGPSGAGKTTLIRMLIGETKPSEGRILFDGIVVHKLGKSKLPRLRRRIGVVFQDFKLLPRKTAAENLIFAMQVAGREDSDIHVDVPHMLDMVNLSNKAGHFPYQLSGGERQRLAIARALINSPDVVVADEPTGNLDEGATHEIVALLKKIHSMGTTVILTTHDVTVLGNIASRKVVLDRGQIINDTKKSRG